MKPDDETRALKSVLFDQAVETSRREGSLSHLHRCTDWDW